MWRHGDGVGLEEEREEKKETKIVGIEKIFVLREDQFSFLVEVPDSKEYTLVSYGIWDKKVKIFRDVPKKKKCWAILVLGSSPWIKEIHINSLKQISGVSLE